MEEFIKERRLLLMNLSLSFIIQLIILGIYYFGEKQVALIFPMLLGLFLTGMTLVRVYLNYKLPK